MRSCPTQAIRIRNNKPIISEELCIDCGNCISICSQGAFLPVSDLISDISHFKYKVVIPASIFYSQFDSSIHPYIIHQALKKLGFDEVVDITISSSNLAVALKKYIKDYQGRLPLISSHCPATLRLIQVKYPDLIDHIEPLDVPREITARETKKRLTEKSGIKPEDIGITYIAPCPAKIISIKQPAEKPTSWFDGVISIKDVYSLLYPHILSLKDTFDEKQIPENFIFHTGWAIPGRVTQSHETQNWLSVFGLNNVMKILNDIENSRLQDIDFVEAMSCSMSCLGGIFNVENPYIARTNSIKQNIKYETPIKVDKKEVVRKLKESYYFWEHPIKPRPTKYFDTDLITSIKKIKERDRIYQNLRKIDCGCCGAPTCMTFAEDIVRGEAELTDCIFIAKDVGCK